MIDQILTLDTGTVAQLAERPLCDREIAGRSPAESYQRL